MLIRFERGEPKAAVTMRCWRQPGVARDRGAGLCIAVPEHGRAGARMIKGSWTSVSVRMVQAGLEWPLCERAGPGSVPV